MKRDIQAVFREYMQLERMRRCETLTVSQMQRLAELHARLDRHFHPDAVEVEVDRRRSVRVPSRLQVTFRGAGELQQSLIAKLSRGGLFVSTETPLEIGARLTLSVRLEEDGREIDVEGEVVSRNLGAHLVCEGPGMGIRFCNLSEEDRKLIDDLYECEFARAVGASPDEDPSADGEGGAGA